ncbi:hypothetical protein CEXT_242161 [Caerostris extrusa]|uniref:Uncharacterized protein n=1 Tax=Caerostris extrusa TaxID=172846 RepID=A0AAV4S3N5_CAEEX|nr:hypothetical protein CEXT_242161 [Caerostris extrusa]
MRKTQSRMLVSSSVRSHALTRMRGVVQPLGRMLKSGERGAPTGCTRLPRSKVRGPSPLLPQYLPPDTSSPPSETDFVYHCIYNSVAGLNRQDKRNLLRSR